MRLVKTPPEVWKIPGATGRPGALLRGIEFSKRRRKLSEGSLPRAIAHYMAHYHTERNHRGLENGSNDQNRAALPMTDASIAGHALTASAEFLDITRLTRTLSRAAGSRDSGISR